MTSNKKKNKKAFNFKVVLKNWSHKIFYDFNENKIKFINHFILRSSKIFYNLLLFKY